MQTVKLGSILHMEKGKKPIAQSKESLHGYLPYVDIKAFEEGIIDNYAIVDKSLLCEDGDLLIVCDGSRSGLTGKAIKGVVGSTLSKIYADGLDTEYLHYFIQSKYALLNTQKKGTGTPHLNAEILKASKLYIPPLPEQERIVARIEELFSELDKAVETLQTTKQQLAVYRQAVQKEVFEGDYPEVQLKEISTTISGYAFKSKKYTPDGKYIVVKIGNVKERHFDFSRDLTRTNEADGNILDKYLLRHGDCLITLTGSRGKRDYGFIAMINKESIYLLNQRVAALRFDETKALPEFYQYYLSSPDYRNKFFSYETGNVGQGNVGVKALWEPTVLLPSIEKQKKIVAEIESRLSVCDSIEQTVNTALSQADAMRQSILKQAFEGRLA
jgi:type I restriction enzyme S subunit